MKKQVLKYTGWQEKIPEKLTSKTSEKHLNGEKKGFFKIYFSKKRSMLKLIFFICIINHNL